jgi:hypothetical protein
MPLFRRPDGDLIKDLDPVRKMMPFVMRGRNESIIFQDTEWEVTRAREWLRKYNRARTGQPRATLFHLLVHALARQFHERPGLNRFVSGGRIYQRKGVWISFAAKTEMTEDAPLVTIKLEFPEGESFADCVKRIVDAIEDRRSGAENQVDREVKFLSKLPTPLLRAIFAGGRWLDRLNLLPNSMIEPDPMYTSIFLGNLGSIGISRVHHHLYEYATASFFGVIGEVRNAVEADRKGNVVARQVLPIQWSFDERINDGFYCAQSIALTQRIFEDPDTNVGLQIAERATAPALESSAVAQ